MATKKNEKTEKVGRKIGGVAAIITCRENFARVVDRITMVATAYNLDSSCR